MNRELFLSFYNDAIEKIAIECCKKNPEFEYKPNCDGVYEEYLNQKTLLHYLLKKDIREGRKKNRDKLDGHKVAACITFAITKVRIITSQNNDDRKETPYLFEASNRMNEQVALFCGISCLTLYMVEDPKNLWPEGVETDKVDLKFPSTTYNNGTKYISSLIRGLYFSNIMSLDNPLLLAHIYFFIDQYHRQSVELIDVSKRLKHLQEEPDYS